MSGTYQGASVALKRMSRANAQPARPAPPSGAAVVGVSGRASAVSSNGPAPGDKRFSGARRHGGNRSSLESVSRSRSFRTSSQQQGGSVQAPTRESAGSPGALQGSKDGSRFSVARFSVATSSACAQSSTAGSAAMQLSQMSQMSQMSGDDATSSGGIDDDVAALFARKTRRRSIGPEGGAVAALCDPGLSLDISEEARACCCAVSRAQGRTAPLLCALGGVSRNPDPRTSLFSRLQMSLLVHLRHPNVAQVFGAVVDLPEPVLVMVRTRPCARTHALRPQGAAPAQQSPFQYSKVNPAPRRPLVADRNNVLFSEHQQELFEYGSLFDLLRNVTVELDMKTRLSILRDVVHGMRFLHDVKPREVLHMGARMPSSLPSLGALVPRSNAVRLFE